MRKMELKPAPGAILPNGCATGEGLLADDVRTRERAYPFGRS